MGWLKKEGRFFDGINPAVAGPDGRMGRISRGFARINADGGQRPGCLLCVIRFALLHHEDRKSTKGEAVDSVLSPVSGWLRENEWKAF